MTALSDLEQQGYGLIDSAGWIDWILWIDRLRRIHIRFQRSMFTVYGYGSVPAYDTDHKMIKHK